ncbi:MAG: hypothetical protein GYB64_18195 [Chloroflexi bacterium]|nr:hypothetical protein [Chloroflexota bacterium]
MAYTIRRMIDDPIVFVSLEPPVSGSIMDEINVSVAGMFRDEPDPIRIIDVRKLDEDYVLPVAPAGVIYIVVGFDEMQGNGAPVVGSFDEAISLAHNELHARAA